MIYIIKYKLKLILKLHVYNIYIEKYYIYIFLSFIYLKTIYIYIINFIHKI